MAPAETQHRPDSLDLAKMSEGEIAAAIAERMQAFRRAHNLPDDRPVYERPIYERAADKAPPREAPVRAPEAVEAPEPETAEPDAVEEQEAEPPEARQELRARRDFDGDVGGGFSGDFSRLMAERGSSPGATTAQAAVESRIPPALVIPPDLWRVTAAEKKRQTAKHDAATRSSAVTVLKRAAIVAAIGAVLWVVWPMRGGDVPLRPAALTPNLEALQDAADALAGAPSPAVPPAPDTLPAASEPVIEPPAATTAAAPEAPIGDVPEAPVADVPEAPVTQDPPDLRPAPETIEARTEDAPPQSSPQPSPTPSAEASPPPLAPIAPQAETVAPAPVHKPDTEPFTPVARPFVPAANAATPAAEPVAKPLALQPGPYRPTAKPFVPAGETPIQPKPKPFVPTPNP